jgi:hypothetical protein
MFKGPLTVAKGRLVYGWEVGGRVLRICRADAAALVSGLLEGKDICIYPEGRRVYLSPTPAGFLLEDGCGWAVALDSPSELAAGLAGLIRDGFDAASAAWDPSWERSAASRRDRGLAGVFG